MPNLFQIFLPKLRTGNFLISKDSSRLGVLVCLHHTQDFPYRLRLSHFFHYVWVTSL